MTATRLHLRDYQREAVDAIHAAHDSGMVSPAVVMATGLGKTVCFARLAAEHIERHGSRVLVLAHREELVDQAIDKIRSISPDLHVGKIKAGDNDVHATVLVASVQTLSRSRRLDQVLSGTPEIGLVITDEVHHSAAASYRKIYDALPGAKRAGFTATLVRGDGIGLGSVIDDVVYSKSVLWGIAGNHLVDVRGVAVDIDGLNLGSVKKSGGDFQIRDLGEAMEDAGAPWIVAQAMKQHADGRRSIVFTPTVGMAHAVAEALTENGTPCGVVEGRTPRDERLRIYDDFRTGKIQALVNCMVLTEGADFPYADCAVIARPTQSPGLYVQMVGRVLRPWPGKKDALVLDMTGTGGQISTLIDLAPGEVRNIRPNESLAEAAVRTEKEANKRVSAGSLSFALRHRDMDLFAASSQAWLRTLQGVMFIALKDSFVFLWPGRDGTWDVCLAEKTGPWKRLHEDLPLGTAMAWAETEVDTLHGGDWGIFGGYGITKDSSWRKTPASDGQRTVARMLRVEIPEKARKGEASDLISVAKASKKFDRYVGKV